MTSPAAAQVAPPAPAAPPARRGGHRWFGDAMGRRWPESLAWGLGTFLAAGIPGIYCWIVVVAAIIDWLQVNVGGGPGSQDWEALSLHLPIGIVIGIASWGIAAVICLVIARWRRLCAVPMLAIGWIGFIAPFMIWMAFLKP